jgi:uncharacterized protein
MNAGGGKVASVGVGLRGPHFTEVLESRPSIGWFEVHAENYLDGAPGRRELQRVRRDYPLSLHGVGLSLGSARGIDSRHLQSLKQLSDEFEPGLISEHLSWSGADGMSLNDLLPLPYTEECLAIVCRNIEQAQEVLGRNILVENPSSYLRYRHSTISEADFLAALARRTGCGLLCDLNNIYVSSQNLGIDPHAYLAALDPATVGEIHLAGHFRTERQGRPMLIDDHGAPVSPQVWELYRYALARFGAVPTLIEWDRNLPPLATLLAEARIAAGMESDLARAA